jgi:hypothetical protein
VIRGGYYEPYVNLLGSRGEAASAVIRSGFHEPYS